MSDARLLGGIWAVLMAVLGAYGVGWGHAHSTVATECRKLGAFYVGSSVFKCEEVKK